MIEGHGRSKVRAGLREMCWSEGPTARSGVSVRVSGVGRSQMSTQSKTLPISPADAGVSHDQ